MRAEPAVLGNETTPVLDRGGEDQPIGWITREGRWESDGGRRDRRGQWKRTHLSSELLEP